MCDEIARRFLPHIVGDASRHLRLRVLAAAGQPPGLPVRGFDRGLEFPAERAPGEGPRRAR